MARSPLQVLIFNLKQLVMRVSLLSIIYQVAAGMFLHAMTGKEYYRIDKTISNDLIK